MANVLWVPMIFCMATVFLWSLTKFAPGLQEEQSLSFQFPSSLDELKNLAQLLQIYKASHPLYISILFASAYLYKQSFAIPGSVFLNLLGGTLFGMPFGFLLVSLLSACGASSCYLLSKCFGRQHIVAWFPEKIELVRSRIEEHRGDLFSFLLFIRLFPMTPNWFINIASPILDIPLHLFFLSVFLGLMPYNFICVQTGVILGQVRSLDDIFTFGMMAKFTMIAVVALIPVALKRRSVKVHKVS